MRAEKRLGDRAHRRTVLSARLLHTAGAAALLLLSARSASGLAQRCRGEAEQPRIDAALTRIRASIDPCGESSVVLAVLETLEHCATSYQICTDLESDRNSFGGPVGAAPLRTIIWNPSLTTPLEPGCDGNPGQPVLRDATASLLHELAHAAQDCDGLDPTEHELEALRVENVYRRAAGLCQRTRYGEQPLPANLSVLCEPGHCACTLPPTDAADPAITAGPVTAYRREAGLPLHSPASPSDEIRATRYEIRVPLHESRITSPPRAADAEPAAVTR